MARRRPRRPARAAGEVREFLQALPAKYLEYFIKKNNITTAQATPLASDAVYKLANSYGVAPQEVGPNSGRS